MTWDWQVFLRHESSLAAGDCASCMHIYTLVSTKLLHTTDFFFLSWSPGLLETDSRTGHESPPVLVPLHSPSSGSYPSLEHGDVESPSGFTDHTYYALDAMPSATHQRAQESQNDGGYSEIGPNVGRSAGQERYEMETIYTSPQSQVVQHANQFLSTVAEKLWRGWGCRWEEVAQPPPPTVVSYSGVV